MQRLLLITILICWTILGAACGMANPAAPVPELSSGRQSATYDPLAPLQAAPLGVSHIVDLPGTTVGSRTVIAATASDTADPAVQAALILGGQGSNLDIALAGPLADAVLYVRYDATREHFAAAQVPGTDRVSLVHEVEPGLLAVAVSATTSVGLGTGSPLARLTFAPGTALPVHATSLITNNVRAKVDNLTAVDNGDTNATLQWSERNPGDYDLNGEVNAADLTQIGKHYKHVYTAADADYAQLEVVDGDANGEINQADITVIGQSFKSFITGYDLYRTPLNTPTEQPDPTVSARWTKVVNTADPTGPSAPRQTNAQDFRLVYTFIDASGAGDFGWFVRATGPNPGELGTISGVATKTIGPGAPPAGGLSFEIEPPQGPVVAAGSDVYIGVKLTGAINLFSANIRFEYDSTLLQFVEVVPAYNDGTNHPNMLAPPLFVGADNVGAATAPYRLLGFNATQTAGTPVVNGDGVLGYAHFTATGVGVNAAAVRFPQSTNFIYLWGDQYGVPCMTPTLGPALGITVL